MEVTRHLLTEWASKKTPARIQLSWWAGQRLRLSSGQKMDPKDWDTKRKRTKAKTSNYLDGINDSFDHYTERESVH